MELENRIDGLLTKESEKDFDKDMIKVEGGKYKPSFHDYELVVADLWIGKYQVTQEKWEEIMGTNPSLFKGSRRPVEKVSWIDALEFCNKMSEEYGLQPVYKIMNAVLIKVIHLDGEEVEPNLADFTKTEGYRLLTELEWEWAARGGDIARREGTFSFKYSGSDIAEEVAWYSQNSWYKTHDVGLKKSNQFGLYDMSGNVWEWCYDSASDGYISEDKPYRYDGSLGDRKLKGGSSWDSVVNIGIASGCYIDLASRYKDYGFRVCCTVQQR